MPPAKSKTKQPDSPPPKKYLPLWLDGDDSSSPPPSKVTRNATSTKSAHPKAKSKKLRKRKPALTAQPTAPQPEVDSDDEPIDLSGPVVDYFSREHSVPEPTTPVGKPSQSRAKTQVRHGSRPESEYDSADNLIVEYDTSDAEVLQDGRGDPNMSAISPPLPCNLVEPQLRGHETGFHVVTAGTEVGISIFRGIAEALLDCRAPSMATFSTWASARDYYIECFDHGSIHIREARRGRTPIQSPVRKKQKLAPLPRLPQANAPSEPHFAPAIKPNPGVQVTTNHLGPASNSQPQIAPAINSNAGLQVITSDLGTANDPVELLAQAINTRYLRERQAARRPIDSHKPPKRQALAHPPSSPPIFRPRARVVVVDSDDEDLPASAASTKEERTDLNTRPRVIVVDSSDDELSAVARSTKEVRSDPNATLPIASSSHSSNPPRTTCEESAVIFISDSDEEGQRFPDSDTARELNKLYGVHKPGPTPRGHRRLL